MKLVKRPENARSIYYRSYEKYPGFRQFATKTYKINGWGWTSEEPGVYKQYYRLDAYCDDFLDYHNRILEDEIEPVGETHPFDDNELTYKSASGDVIEIGTTGYNSVLFGNYDDPYMDHRLTFTKFGKVTAIHKFCEDDYPNHPRKTISFQCLKDKHYDSHGDNHYHLCDGDGRITEELAPYLLTTPDERFAEKFVKRLGQMRDRKILSDENNHDYWLVKEWLQHMRIYDKVMEIFNSGSTSKKKTSTGKKSSTVKKTPKKKVASEKLSDFLAGLSEEEREKLKSML